LKCSTIPGKKSLKPRTCILTLADPCACLASEFTQINRKKHGGYLLGLKWAQYTKMPLLLDKLSSWNASPVDLQWCRLRTRYCSGVYFGPAAPLRSGHQLRRSTLAGPLQASNWSKPFIVATLQLLPLRMSMEPGGARGVNDDQIWATSRKGISGF
jgi:hypothetical protein